MLFYNGLDGLIVISFFIIVMSFLFFTKTLSSGYHFIDDHEMLVINSDLKNASLLPTCIKWMENDLIQRFRPLYYVHRVLEIRVFGVDFFALSFYTGILATFTFSLFYLAARKLKYSVFESLIFVLLTFVGPQATIWWMLGPSETIGMVFLGLSFYFMATCIEGNNSLIKNILFVLFLIAASLCKESFIIIIPAFVLYKICNEQQVFGISINKSIRNNLILLLPIVAMIIELWVIFFIVGTNKIRYAGLISNSQELFSGFKRIISNKDMLTPWFELTVVSSLIYFLDLIFSQAEWRSRIKQSFKDIGVALAFALLILMPNVLLYAKSGISDRYERYLLPAVFGLALFAVHVMRKTDKLLLKSIAIGVIFIFLSVMFNTAVGIASAFASDGNQTNELLSSIMKFAKTNSNILLVADPVNRFEVSYSTRTYIAHEGIDSLYAYPIIRKYNSDFELYLEKTWGEWFKNKMLNDIFGLPQLIIFIDKSQSGRFFRESGLDQSDYENVIVASNPHALYLKIPRK